MHVCKVYIYIYRERERDTVHLSIRIIKLSILLDFIVKFLSEHLERRGMGKWSQSIQIIKIPFAIFFH